MCLLQNKEMRSGNVRSIKKATTLSNASHIRKIESEEETFRHKKVDLKLSKLLGQARTKKNMTQDQLAKTMNVQVSIIKNIENGTAIPNKEIISNKTY